MNQQMTVILELENISWYGQSMMIDKDNWNEFIIIPSSIIIWYEFWYILHPIIVMRYEKVITLIPPYIKHCHQWNINWLNIDIVMMTFIFTNC